MPEPKHQVTAQCEFFITELSSPEALLMRGRPSPTQGLTNLLPTRRHQAEEGWTRRGQLGFGPGREFVTGVLSLFQSRHGTLTRIVSRDLSPHYRRFATVNSICVSMRMDSNTDARVVAEPTQRSPKLATTATSRTRLRTSVLRR